MEYTKDLSIVISLYNEEESLHELVKWIENVMEKEGYTYEIIMVDDGSKDRSWEIVKGLSEKNENIRGISFRRNYGKSAALYHGFKAADGRVVVTMDADLQDSPEEIPEMYRMIVEEGYDIVSGWKKQRFDNKLTKNIPSKLYNATARWVTGIKLHDMNCGLKAYRNEVVKNIEVYGEMHRYIPYLAKTVRTKWYGETEKLVKKVFTDYKDFVAQSAKTPILLFNEADAILSVRSELGADSTSCTKTENAIQNILLQEMETFDGILIATTNLTNNLDAAFERRFLYKIKFEKPDLEAKSAIWRSLMPSLTKDDALILASEYDFSGGEISNIARKCFINELLFKQTTSLEQIKAICSQEKLTKRVKIGF